jgi:hypothetical protein
VDGWLPALWSAQGMFTKLHWKLAFCYFYKKMLTISVNFIW